MRLRSVMSASAPARLSRHRAAFTILELMVSLAAMGLLATICIPAYFNRPEVTLEKAGTLLARDIRSTQNRAAIWHKRLGMRFHRTGYDVVDESGRVVRGPMDQPFRRNYAIDAVFEDVEVAHVSLGGDSELWFDARGEAEESGSVVLRYYEGHARTISIVKRTGRVNIDGD